MAKNLQQLQRPSFVIAIINPYFRQTLIGGQFARRTSEEFTLDAGTNPFCF